MRVVLLLRRGCADECSVESLAGAALATLESPRERIDPP